VILTAAEFVRDGLPAGHEVAEDVEEIARTAERAADLTQHLLIFSRRERSKREVVDLHDVLADTERLLRRTLPDNVALRAEPGHAAALVLADRGQLEQVVVNHVLNARDAMPDGGQVVVGTEHVELEAAEAARRGVPPGRFVHLTVSDTGEGMDEWVVQRAFEPFFTTKPKGSGTGLGLATAYGIVMGSGGHIELLSAPGKGTTVSIHLPLSQAEAPEPGPGPAPAPAAPEAGAGLVLLVEDEEALRRLTRRILTKHGYVVLETANVADALVAFESAERPPDLLLTDVVMPGGSGPELRERLRERVPGLPTVFMSGYTDDVMERYGIEATQEELLQKPFNAAGLVAAVGRALGA